MEYRREIDGLRAVAVVPVILFHAGVAAFAGGYVGVDVFFVVSGYLITTLLVQEHEADRFSIVRFYERRARRILPALTLVVLCCLPFAWVWMLPYQLVDFAKSVMAVALFSSNILFWREIGYFGPLNEAKPLLHTWSLAVEEQYYLLFPLCIALLWRISRRAIPALLATVAVASLAIGHWAALRFTGAAFYLAPSRIWEILLGALAAFILGSSPNVQNARSPLGRSLREGAAIAGLAAIIYAVFRFDSSTPVPGLPALVPTLGAVSIILFGGRSTAIGQMLGCRPLVGLGLISYSAYLWHQPMFAFARLRSGTPPGPGLLSFLGGVVIALAYLSWRFVEQPFRDRTRVRSRTIFAGAAATMLLLVAVGAAGQIDQGFISRFPPADRYLVGFSPGAMGRYVAARFDERRLAPFAPGTRKVFIVGDSYAQDLVNAIAESRAFEDASLSTHHIASWCGALVSSTDLTPFIEPGERAACARNGRFENPIARDRLREADLVMLAANWREWQPQFLGETLAALRSFGAKRVLVIGRKSFGHVAPLKYLSLTPEQRRELRNPVDPAQQVIDADLRRVLPADVYVDFQSTICGDESTCPVFTEDLRLISFDGEHLTQDGARFVGTRLFRHPLLTAVHSMSVAQ